MSLLVWSRQILPVCPHGRGRLLVTAVSPGVMWGHTVSWRVWSLLLVDFIRQLSQDSLYFCRAEADWQRSRQRCVIGSVGGKANHCDEDWPGGRTEEERTGLWICSSCCCCNWRRCWNMRCWGESWRERKKHMLVGHLFFSLVFSLCGDSFFWGPIILWTTTTLSLLNFLVPGVQFSPLFFFSLQFLPRSMRWDVQITFYFFPSPMSNIFICVYRTHLLGLFAGLMLKHSQVNLLLMPLVEVS